MIFGGDKKPNRTVEKIIRTRGEEPQQWVPDGDDVGAAAYAPYLATQGWPQMGFSVFTRGGGRHGFLYHNLENLDLIEKGGEEFLRFTHRGKAVSMRGRGLHGIFDAVMDHTLQAIYEFSDVWAAPEPDADIVDRIQIDSLEDMIDMAARNMRERGRSV